MRKDQSSIIGLAKKYFLSNHCEKFIIDKINYKINGEIIINFNEKIFKGKDQFGKSTLDYFARHWDLQKEIYHLK